MFSKKTRKGLVGGVALTLAGVMAGEASAAKAILLDKGICKDHAVPVMVEWGNANGYDKRFFMMDNGDIVKMDDGLEFKDVTDLLVAGHGASGNAMGLEAVKFADAIRAGGAEPAKLDNVTMGMCCSAGANGDEKSVIVALQEKFPDIKKIVGSPDTVYLAGYKKADFKSAELSGGYQSGSETALSVLNTNIDVIWRQTSNVFNGAAYSFANSCEKLKEASSKTAGDLPQGKIDAVAWAKFILERIHAIYMPADKTSEPQRSFSMYTENIKAKNPMFTCGKSVVSENPVAKKKCDSF
ncbi:hypothetical protein PsAD2_01204 [Pseudovibrio axinellae]|uniref:Uncharacterized protein n=1 Tax=Pseudovibrio axinellae TaxID=989403 RepID=A0A166A888_9HYPH|nr:hypothetical protein [Pseudovibrio axinellae]KZL20716.1 hypothetical protein PsAD2_01204 [Pseudovibrio axinellae]SER24866.1 hypothetical protein SAMN05421798_107173 [Pseudovibrio axinellae]